MTPRELYLLDARRRARTIRGARNETLRQALIRRVLFDLREALRQPTSSEPRPTK